MIQDFSEEDILNYLMVSEFNEGLTSEEFKFLLLKFRYYYRLMYSRRDSMKIEINSLQTTLNVNQDIYIKNLDNLKIEIEKLEKRYNQLINRKLTWVERLKGKIIINKNEIN
jgi:hypothetical protein